MHLTCFSEGSPLKESSWFVSVARSFVVWEHTFQTQWRRIPPFPSTPTAYCPHICHSSGSTIQKRPTGFSDHMLTSPMLNYTEFTQTSSHRNISCQFFQEPFCFQELCWRQTQPYAARGSFALRSAGSNDRKTSRLRYKQLILYPNQSVTCTHFSPHSPGMLF